MSQLQNAFCCGSLHLTQPLRAGLKDYKVLKTTQSGYVGYLKDRYTLLPETTERMAATSITASWRWGLYFLLTSAALQLQMRRI